MKIRIAKVSDAKALLEIYAPYVEKTAITYEYELPSVAEFEARIAGVLKKFPYLVAEEGGEILGYAYAAPFKGRPAYDWAVETSIYVPEDMKGAGLGRKLYKALESVLEKQGILNLNAAITYPEVEDEYANRNSVDFHAHMGYRMVGVFHKAGYKFGRWYDTAWMEKHIGGHVAEPEKVRTFEEVREAAEIEGME